MNDWIQLGIVFGFVIVFSLCLAIRESRKENERRNHQIEIESKRSKHYAKLYKEESERLTQHIRVIVRDELAKLGKQS